MPPHLVSSHKACPFAPDCSFTGTAPNIEVHKKTCNHRRATCPQVSCSLEISRSLFWVHWKHAHSTSIVAPTTPDIWTMKYSLEFVFNPNELKGRSGQCKTWETGAFRFDQQLFFLNLQRTKRNDMFFMWMSMAGDQVMADQYRVNLLLGKGDNRLRWQMGVFTLDQSRESVYESRDCVALPKKMIQGMLSKAAVSEKVSSVAHLIMLALPVICEFSVG